MRNFELIRGMKMPSETSQKVITLDMGDLDFSLMDEIAIKVSRLILVTKLNELKHRDYGKTVEISFPTMVQEICKLAISDYLITKKTRKHLGS